MTPERQTEVREEIERLAAPISDRILRRIRSEDRHVGLGERPAGGPLVQLRGADPDRCPAHPSEDRYSCLPCSELS